jgi:hypothetical protein
MSTNGSVKKDITRIPVAYLVLGWENNRKAVVDFFLNARSMVNVVTDALFPPVTTALDWLIKELLDARSRGVIIRLITYITKENLSACKDRLNQVDEMRHLNGIRMVFAVSDSGFIALVPSAAPREDIEKIQFIQSDSEKVVATRNVVFEALLTRAVPCQLRIDELERKVTGTGTGTEAAMQVIYRIYKCVDCKEQFVFSWEVRNHRNTTGHHSYDEYPIV